VPRRPSRPWRAALAAAGVLAAAFAAPAAARPGAPHHQRGPACGPSIAPKDAPTAGNSTPPPAPRYFASDFPTITDSRLHQPIGGFGGIHRHAELHHTPVIFVHGNQADAQNWLATMLQFQRLAGYSMQEMYAISYNGLGNFYAGAPATQPTNPDQDYFQQNPTGFANGGHGAADDDEVPDLCRFIEAVQAYTGSKQVDLVTHSLGVTIGRELIREYPAFNQDIRGFVAIAGANHGTSVCRGLDTSYYGCDEIAPGSPWLQRLNGYGEAPLPTRWMTVYNGSAGDPFFDPPLDQASPHLNGAINATFAGAYHNDLRVDPQEVDDYLAFLLLYAQAGPGGDYRDRALAQRLVTTHPDGRSGTLCGVPRLTGC